MDYLSTHLTSISHVARISLLAASILTIEFIIYSKYTMDFHIQRTRSRAKRTISALNSLLSKRRKTVICPEDYQLAESIEAFHCPISREIMREPVMTPYGHCFEEEWISHWLKTHHSCPLTKKHLILTDLSPCEPLKAAIQQLILLRKGCL